MIKNSNRKRCSGHLEIILAVIIAIIGVAWYFSSHSAKNRQMSGYYPAPQYASVESPQGLPTLDALNSGKINTTLLWVSGGLIYIIGVMSGLFFPLIHSIKHKNHKVPFSFSCMLPTKGNRAMGFLDDLQKMRDAGLISKHEYDSKRLEFLAKL